MISPTPTPLSLSIRAALPPRQRGLSLVELAIVLGVSAGIIAGAWSLYSAGDASRRARSDALTVAAITQAIDRTWASRADFSDLDQAAALSARVFPRNSIDRTGRPRNAWGGGIEVEGLSTAGPGSLSRPVNGFAITLADLPPAACLRTAVQAGAGFFDVEVDGVSVISGAQRERVDAVAAARACGTTPSARAPAPRSVAFIAARQDLGTGVPTCQPLPPETRPALCPDGQLSSDPPHSPWGRVEGRSSYCEAIGGPLMWTGWELIDDACVPACVAPPPESQWVPRSAPCPVGQLGSHTWETLQQNHASCPQPVGDASWGGWADVDPEQRRDEVNTCAPSCASQLPAPNPETACGDAIGMPQQVDTACPAGQELQAAGSYFWVYSRLAVCPAPTGLPVWSPDWTATPSRCAVVPATCAPSCTPSTTTATREQPCPPGYTGTWTQTQQVTSPCPAGTPPTATPWAPTDPPAGACVATPGPSCPPPPPPEYRTMPCPVGQTGSGVYQVIEWVPAPWPACGAFGPWTTYYTECAPTAAPPACTNPAPTTSPACPAGGHQTGGTWSQAPAPACTWAYAGGSCPPPPTCTNPAPTTAPACPAGGNQTGGTWTRSPPPACVWTYAGGACPPPSGTWSGYDAIAPEAACSGLSRYVDAWSGWMAGVAIDRGCAYDATNPPSFVSCWGGGPGLPPNPYPPGVECIVGDWWQRDYCEGGSPGASVGGVAFYECVP